jgi:hypothetical protein
VERRTSHTIVPNQPQRTSVWATIVLLVSLVATVGIVSLFMVRNHAWAERVLARLPAPGPATSMAADPGLADQIRILAGDAWFTKLGDQTSALVAESIVVNDSPIPVHNVVIEASVVDGAKTVGTVLVSCGKPVSDRLLRRLTREELRALADLTPPASRPLTTGERLRCQVAFSGITPAGQDVTFRVASVEPYPGHPDPLFHPGG